MIWANNFLFVTVHPLTIIAASAILSIFLFCHPWAWIIAGIFLIGLMYCINTQWSSYWLFVLFCVYAASAWQYHAHITRHAFFMHLLQDKPCTIQGTVSSIEYLSDGRTKQKIILETDRFIFSDQEAHELKKTICFYLAKQSSLQVADKIEVYDVCIKKNNNKSYEHYLVKENIAATIFMPLLSYSLIEKPSFSLWRSLFEWKQRVLIRCKKKLSCCTFSFFSSVFLGNKTHEKKYMEKPKESCKIWGISHYLARSGLHMVIFIYLWHLILSMLPLPFILKEIILIVIGILYHLLSWPSISFIRAFISFLLYKTCSLLRIQSQLIHLLSLVTIGILLWSPLQLFFLDFQLSFGLTFALAWFNRVATQKAFLTAKY